ncbi:RNA repair transcriptional activator RtcR [Suttonella ornithocola]|uniref:Quorum-sensing regulator protein F n=1 Tax=Suttonella ornithocola TaxID=279832 RepID=A0A380MTW4_9GAMM|nr:RNA repair transcriptional activator RtcR [Suttonella ornithocola]SUO95708.1 Quorum-sensing regulator protein F [Suttonella ornithocola]
MNAQIWLAELMAGIHPPQVLSYRDAAQRALIEAAQPLIEAGVLGILQKQQHAIIYRIEDRKAAQTLFAQEIAPRDIPVAKTDAEVHDIVLIGTIGSKLDAGQGRKRWQKWRPSIAIHQQTAFQLKRCELFYQQSYQTIAEQVVTDIAHLSPQTSVQLHDMAFEDAWDFAEVYGKLFDWAKNYPFDTEKETYWVNITTGTHVVQICLFLLVATHIIPAQLLQLSPPKRQKHSLLQGDVGHHELIDLNLARYDALAERLAHVQADAVAYLKSGIATRNPIFNRMIAEIEQVALRSPAPILLTGATGTGKSMLAKRIYELKKARHLVKGRLVDVNCATLRGDNAAAALFGHTKGAFTGAATARDGYLKSADGGVLFLDEIGELGLDEQAMLLKALEEKRYYPLGSDREVESDFQLIAGTNMDLQQAVAAGTFREDLYARINIWQYRLPTLAERREDIEPNIDHQLALIAAEFGRRIRFKEKARAIYLQFAESSEAQWKGNFRDLAASMMRLATLAENGMIDEVQVHTEIARLKNLWQPVYEEKSEDNLLAKYVNPENLDYIEQVQLNAVLKVCQESLTLAEAGRRLFNVSRQQKTHQNDSDRLRKYLAKYHLSWKEI